MANWSISYTDVFGKKKVESFQDKDAAQARYEDLLPRTYGDLGDLVNVTAPVRSAVKVSEGIFYGSADKKAPNRYADGKEEWDDFKDVVRKLLAEFDDRAETKFFKVVPIGNDNYEIYFKGDGDKLSDLLFMSIYQSSFGEPTISVIKGDVSDAVFDDAYDIVEPYIADVFRLAYDDGNTGIVRKFYSSGDYHKSLKEDCGGSSAASLGAVPTATVRPSNNRGVGKSEGVTFDKVSLMDDCYDAVTTLIMSDPTVKSLGLSVVKDEKAGPSFSGVYIHDANEDPVLAFEFYDKGYFHIVWYEDGDDISEGPMRKFGSAEALVDYFKDDAIDYLKRVKG